MKQKKLNCIRGTLRHRLPGLGSLLALTLAALLLASPALAAGDNAIVPKVSLANKPEVTIQGNVVVDDNGAPTGFYELALCVRSPKRVVDVNGLTDDPANPGTPVAPGTEISESAYHAYVAANPGTEGDFTVTYYPFAAASAVVEINADVLTAVNWDVESVTYDEWDAAANAYKTAGLDSAYPRGIDLTPTTGGNFDPDVWSETDPEPFPDITTATLQGIHRVPVALDAEGDRSAFTAAAQVDDYAETATAKTALVTLSAHAPDNKPVIYTKSTPVAVVRFSYDLARFPKGSVMVNSAVGDVRNRVTGTAANEGFWLGLDRGNNTTVNSGKTPLTWLADTALGTGGNSYDYSDARDAATEAGQAVWTKLSSKDTSGGSIAEWTDTEYYYYLGGEYPSGSGAEGTVSVSTPGGIQDVEHVWVPNTASRIKILAEGTQENPMPGAGDTWTQAQYSYYNNLISLNGGVRLELVNALTFRKPTGGKGGTQILFYDWDDRLIGALIVGKGDVRDDVNSYVERNFIAPDLRASQYLDNGEVPTDPTDLADYENVVNSLDREFTYRGSQYPYRLNGGDALKDAKGDDYPLTNKLDYVFYKRLNLVNTLRTPDAADPTNADKDTVENYYTVAPVSSDTETGKYPYVYGWAIVEDPANKKIETAGENWAVKLDSVNTESTWTTFDSGELGGLEPSYTAKGYPAQAIPTGTVETQPGGLSSPLPHAINYDYMTSSADANGYLRFADFSDMEAMLKDGQDVLIVKAVYEPGTDLLGLANYTSVEGSLYTIRYSTDASTGNAVYSIQYQYQRANDTNGDWQGVKRIREPAVNTGYTYDINEFDDPALGVDQDLNANRAFSMKTVAVNSDIMDIDILSGGVIWKVDYVLVDLYGGLNVATGDNRSVTGILDLKTGFNYEKPDGSGNEWTYDERQGTDSLNVDATITHILTEATKIARGESTENLSTYFSLATVQDLNLRADMQGTAFTFLNYTACANYTQNLVNAIVAAYPDPDTAPAGIYDQRGAVTLTYHQLQRHIIMARGGNAAGIFVGGSLMADGAAAGFPWCRYDQCSADVKMEINGLGDLLTAVHYIQSLPATDNQYKKAEEALKELTGAQLQGYGFRTHGDGVPYDASAGDAALKKAILDDLKDAVDLLAPSLGTDPDWSTVSWTKAQEAIIQGNMGAATPPTMDLWWQPSDGKPNGTPPTIDSWEKLWKYSIHDTLGVDVDGDGTPDAVVPDAFDSFDQTALDALVSEKPGTSTATNVGWFRTGTVTTVGGEETAEKFTAAGFTTAWAKALQALTSGGAPYTAATVSNATWEEIQYALINGTYKSHTDIMNDASIDYWWKNGGSPKLTFAKLLDAVNDYYFNGDATKLDDILKSGVDPINNQVYLRADDGGTEFGTANAFKTAVYDALMNLDMNGNMADFLDGGTELSAGKVDEYVFQYLLIHSAELANGTITTVPDKDAIRADTVNNDYWWFAGGKPTKPMPLNSVKDLFKAYLWYKGDTSTGVGGQNAQALGNLDAAKLKTLGIRSDGWGVPYAATATNAELIAALDGALGKLPYNMKAVGSVNEADLALELQYLLANPAAAHQSASVLRGSGTSYWWQEGDKSYPIPTNQQEVLEAIWKAHIGNAAGDTVSEAETALKALDIDFITSRKTGMAMRKDLDGNAFADANAFYTALAGAADAMKAGGQGYSDLASITQRQLQWMLLGNAYDTNDNVENATIDKTDPAKPVDAYWWFTSDTKPSEEPTKKEKPIDPAKWSTFIQGLNNYAMLGDDTAFNDGSITLDMINDELYLRKADGSKFADWSEVYDGSMSEVLVNALYAIMTDPDKYAEFWDSEGDGVSLIKEISWYELQYAIIHTDEINASCEFPELPDCKQESEEKYDWRYDITDPKPPEPGKTEKPIDETKWSAFMQGLNNYAMLGDDTAFNDGSITLATVNDELYLRKADGSKFADWSEVYDGSCSEVLVNAFYAIMADPNKYMEFWDSEGDGVSLIKEPSWYEMQYAIIHTDEINASCEFPALEDCKAESEEKYEWRYETGGGEDPGPTKTEIEIDAAKWTTFIQGLNDYAMIGDPSAFDGGALTNALSMINDDLLLRKADGSEFADWSEVYDGSMSEVITNAYYAIMTDMNKYAEFWDSEGDGVSLIKEISWYELQYAIIHTDEINASCVFPDLEDCKKECEEKWDWKYTTS